MIDNLFTVGNQVLILFVLIAVGFICAKTKLLKDEGIEGMTKFVLYIVTPGAIIESFQREFDINLLKNLGIAFAAAIMTHLVTILITSILVKDKDENRKCVLKFAAVFANTGYMALPLQRAVVGSIGVFYGAAYIAVFNIFSWSYGLYVMSGDKKSMSPLKMIKAPGIIGVIIGILIYVFSINLPEIISTPISYVAALNTPLPMIIIGYYLSKLDFRTILKIPGIYVSLFIRLILSPFILFVGMYALGLKGELMTSCIIAASAPVAAITTMFSAMYKRDTEIASGIVSLSTLLAVITMPILVSLTL